ncbi:MAG: lasso RiPP family leader peptide-containing protein [Chloroflexi bacterium]|nr:lasso RiPP family leader peptide-containing protein [Chloroflexota bacterium]
MSYEKPIVRDYGDVAEVTATVTIGTSDDGVIKSSDVVVGSK